ncbi:MAG: hypothetical protein AAFQ22_00415 [Pseudomonadota bacterium]
MELFTLRRILFWGGFATFVCGSTYVYWKPELLDFASTTGIVRAGLIAVWFAFTGYSIYCIPFESLWQSATKILKLLWGWQVTVDLYISVFLSIGLVWLVTGSLVETLIWSIAIVPFANLAILLFLVFHIDEILAVFGIV